MHYKSIAALCGGLLLASSAWAQTGPDLSGNNPNWIKDNGSNCWAANPDPSPGETISWTGGCENNLLSGTGTLTWYINGKAVGRDEGTFKNGELSGHGRLSFADGASYEGDFPGKGVLTLPNGQKIQAESIHEKAGWSIEQSLPQR
jgi:hypothetical protein